MISDIRNLFLKKVDGKQVVYSNEKLVKIKFILLITLHIRKILPKKIIDSGVMDNESVIDDEYIIPASQHLDNLLACLATQE